MTTYATCGHCSGTGKCSCETCWRKQGMDSYKASYKAEHGYKTVCSVCNGTGKARLD